MASEKRLINANALEYTRVQIFHGLNEDGTPCVGGWSAVVMSSAIRDAPTVDAVEVVYGRWIWKPIDERTSQLFCSVCESNDGACEEYNYCPNCGAKMDGERKDND